MLGTGGLEDTTMVLPIYLVITAAAGEAVAAAARVRYPAGQPPGHRQVVEWGYMVKEQMAQVVLVMPMAWPTKMARTVLMERGLRAAGMGRVARAAVPVMEILITVELAHITAAAVHSAVAAAASVMTPAPVVMVAVVRSVSYGVKAELSRRPELQICFPRLYSIIR
jgi:hypothetical protein